MEDAQKLKKLASKTCINDIPRLLRTSTTLLNDSARGARHHFKVSRYDSTTTSPDPLIATFYKFDTVLCILDVSCSVHGSASGFVCKPLVQTVSPPPPGKGFVH
jgi:hypothetical protein